MVQDMTKLYLSKYEEAYHLLERIGTKVGVYVMLTIFERMCNCTENTYLIFFQQEATPSQALRGFPMETTLLFINIALHSLLGAISFADQVRLVRCKQVGVPMADFIVDLKV